MSCRCTAMPRKLPAPQARRICSFPRDVEKVRALLSQNPTDPLSRIAKKLMAPGPELVAMWKAFEKRDSEKLGHCEWVWWFLKDAAEASNMPPLFYSTAKERRALISLLKKASRQLCISLGDYALDAHFVNLTGKLFAGFFFYEDFGYHNKARIDADGKDKLKGAAAIELLVDRAIAKIQNDYGRGKVGKNARAIRFVRRISERNEVYFNATLNSATAAAANALFGTSYGESNIRKLLSR